jgi:Flp pilus assembly protein TadG
MRRPQLCRTGQGRPGAATVELAILLPLLAFLFIVAVDYCRVFHFSQIVSNCARNGAMYGCDPYGAAQSPYSSVEEAARADAPASIRSQLTVTSSTQTVNGNQEFVVTVSYPFTTLTRYIGIPQTVTLTRTVRVPIAPATPK